MTTRVFQYNFDYMVPLDRVSIMMNKLMHRISGLGVNYIYRTLIPTFVHINIPDTFSNSDGIIYRRFLKGLRQVQTEHFVRFSTDLLWVMESDSGDMFYAKEKDSTDHVDIFISVKIVNLNQVEINVKIPSFTNQHVLLRELSSNMLEGEDGPGNDAGDAELFAIMVGLSETRNLGSILRYVDCDLKILLVPAADDEDSYYPIPLYGITEDDTRRRFHASVKDYEFLQKKHDDYFPEESHHLDMLSLLVDEIQCRESINDRSSTASVTYGLAELLFGYYVTSRDGHFSTCKHEAILIEQYKNDDDDSVVDFYNLGLDDISA